MTDFDPKWPHGHIRRDGVTKAEILRTLDDGRHAVLLTGAAGAQWLEMYRADGTPSCHPYVEHFIINAPAPKRGVWVNVYEQNHKRWAKSAETKDDAIAEAERGPTSACCISRAFIEDGRFDE